MRRLVAGPWIGEFGWELLSWQGLLRKAAKDYKEVIVCGRDGHESIYSDFATRYIPHAATGVADCWLARNIDAKQLSTINDHLKALGGDLLRPHGYVPITKQAFVRYGTARRSRRFDIVAHARGKLGNRPQCSWSQENWNELCGRLMTDGLSVACIGTAAFKIEGAEDLRNQLLQDTMNLLAGAAMAVGPSSGPMHLAALCGTPHLIWTDKRYYPAGRSTVRQRYESTWNPLQTPCQVIDDFNWHPPVDIVYATIKELFPQWSSNRR